jgi:predicted nucleotidyltransferase
MSIQIDIDTTEIAAFCSRWNVTEFALFGSVLSADFLPNSDVDVLVTFAPDAGWSLFEFVRMAAELETMVGRHVDLVEQVGLRNPFRRHSILKSKQVIHAA